MDGSYSKGWLGGVDWVHTATRILPNQSSTSCSSGVSLVQTRSMYFVPAPAPATALVMAFSTRPPRDRLSFFVPAYGQIHERSDAGTLSHAPARAQALISRVFSVGLLRYQALITCCGRDLIRKKSFREPGIPATRPILAGLQRRGTA